MKKSRGTIVRPAGIDAVAEAGRILRSGGLVAMPTETVYGLAGDATSDLAVARIFEAKGRPSFNPLIVHVLGRAGADGLVELTPAADALIEAFWPGPLTLVLKKRADCPVSELASAGLETLAVRLPAHVIAREVMAAANLPLAAPSANRSGTLSPTTAAHVAESLGGAVDLILDGGPCPVGIESTIVGVGEDTLWLLRPGSVTAAQLTDVTGLPVKFRIHQHAIEAPGQMQSHYAPDAPVRLNATEPRDGEFLIGFGEVLGHDSLSESGDLVEAAANLFRLMREADAERPTAIAVAPIPETGLGIAINDRLTRAAAPRGAT